MDSPIPEIQTAPVDENYPFQALENIKLTVDFPVINYGVQAPYLLQDIKETTGNNRLIDEILKMIKPG